MQNKYHLDTKPSKLVKCLTKDQPQTHTSSKLKDQIWLSQKPTPV